MIVIILGQTTFRVGQTPDLEGRDAVESLASLAAASVMGHVQFFIAPLALGGFVQFF